MYNVFYASTRKGFSSLTFVKAKNEEKQLKILNHFAHFRGLKIIFKKFYCEFSFWLVFLKNLKKPCANKKNIFKAPVIFKK